MTLYWNRAPHQTLSTVLFAIQIYFNCHQTQYHLLQWAQCLRNHNHCNEFLQTGLKLTLHVDQSLYCVQQAIQPPAESL